MKRFIKIFSLALLCLALSLCCFACKNCKEHIDSDHDGKCDNCNATVTVTHTDSNHDGKCDECGKDTTFSHIDENDDGKCDECGKDLNEKTKAALTNIIAKVGSEDNYTLNLKGAYANPLGGQSDEFGLKLKFTEEGFEIPEFMSGTLYQPNAEEQDTEKTEIGYNTTSLSIRGGDIYLLDEYYYNANSTKEYRLQKIALPQEVAAIGQYADMLVEMVKSYVSDLIKEANLGFMSLNETGSEITLSCGTEIGEILEQIRTALVSHKDNNLYEILDEFLQAQLGTSISDIVSKVLLFSDSTLADFESLLDSTVSAYLGTDLQGLIETVLDFVGITMTPEEFRQTISGLIDGAELPEPEEGQTLSEYMIAAFNGTLGTYTLDQIIAKITKDETATLETLLNKGLNFLKTVTLKNLFSRIIDLDVLENLDFSKFNVSLSIKADKSYSFGSIEFKCENGTETPIFALELSVGDRGTTALSNINEKHLTDTSIVKKVLSALGNNFTVETEMDTNNSDLLSMLLNQFYKKDYLKGIAIKVTEDGADIGPIYLKGDNGEYVENYFYLRDYKLIQRVGETYTVVTEIDPEIYNLVLELISCFKNSALDTKEFKEKILSVFQIQPTEDGYTLTAGSDISFILNTILSFVFENSDHPLTDIIANLIGAGNPEKAEQVKNIITAIINAVSPELSALLSMSIEDMINSLVPGISGGIFGIIQNTLSQFTQFEIGMKINVDKELLIKDIELFITYNYTDNQGTAASETPFNLYLRLKFTKGSAALEDLTGKI